MERKVHWRVSFRTRSEKLGVLKLYEEGYEGEVVDLTGAAMPFETQEDSSDEWLVPIRKQTGYIRVIDEGNTDGIMPVGMKDRYVEYTENGSLKWCGYIVPDVFSAEWDVTPNEVEFPVTGGLGVLEGVYLNEDDGLGVVSLLELLCQCLRETGIDYRNIYIPKEVLKEEGASSYLYPLTLEVSRYNFFRENESLNTDEEDWMRYNGETCFDVISYIMKFWGWTMRERGNDLWITSTTETDAEVYTFAELEDLILGFPLISKERTVKVERVAIGGIGLAGSDHKKDILQGRKKVIVTSSVNPVGAVVPSVDKEDMKFVNSFVGSFSSNGQIYAYEKRVLYTPKDGYKDVVLHSYAKTTMTEVYSEWKEIPQTMDGVTLYVGAYFMEQELVTADEYKKKKNWNLTDTIRINLQDWTDSYPTISEAKELPIVEIKSRRVANYVNGAFVVSAQTRSISQGLMTYYDGNGAGVLEMRFKVGNKYWNGTGWTTQPSWFGVQMGDEENKGNTQGTGKIISTKTLEMPYSGADGYVMPIDEALNGEVELTIHAVRNEGGYAVLMLDNFKVDYYGEDTDQKKSDDTENRYARRTGLNYKSEEEIGLKMATNNNNKAGYGIINLKGENIEKMYFEWNGKEERPEMNLVEKGLRLYGRNTEKLTLQLDKVVANPQDLMEWNGKSYVMASEAVNWADETGQYIIMEI